MPYNKQKNASKEKEKPRVQTVGSFLDNIPENRNVCVLADNVICACGLAGFLKQAYSGDKISKGSPYMGFKFTMSVNLSDPNKTLYIIARA